MSKGFAYVLVLVFLTASTLITFLPTKAESRTIVVPDDYPTLSSAIENATNGDTILVKSGTYQESAINTNKSISIIGEGYQSTIINFTSRGYEVDVSIYEKYYFYDPAILVHANDFSLSGFTINSNGGEISISGNRTQVTANSVGIRFHTFGSYLNIRANSFSNEVAIGADFSRISDNLITSGISVKGQYDMFSLNKIRNSAPIIETNTCLIYGNSITNAPFAIFPLTGKDNIVSNNTIDHLSTGLWVRGSNNTVMLNQITHCGVALLPSPNNTYYANYIANNLWGIDMVGSQLNPYGNTSSLFHNNMINNVYQVNTLFPYKADYFDNGKEGNYWSDYHGTDANSDGVGDTPHAIDANRSDRYPLMSPFNLSSVSDLMPDWSLPPSIELINPTNTIYPNGNVTLNFSIGKQPLWIGYSLDGLSNITATGNITLTNLSSGTHNITVYANDWYQNTGHSTTITFTVEKPELELFPTVPVAAVSVAAAVVVVAGLLVYFKKRKR